MSKSLLYSIFYYNIRCGYFFLGNSGTVLSILSSTSSGSFEKKSIPVTFSTLSTVTMYFFISCEWAVFLKINPMAVGFFLLYISITLKNLSGTATLCPPILFGDFESKIGPHAMYILPYLSAQFLQSSSRSFQSPRFRLPT